MRAAALAISLPALGALVGAQEPIDYQRDVRPILSDNCYQCHGPDGNERKAGLRLDVREAALRELPSGERAIVPNDPDASALLQRVHASDPDVHMPPPKSGKDLTDAQRATLRRWIEQGAEFTQHWSFVAPKRAALPQVRDIEWCRNEIDRFVLAPLETDGMRPKAQTSRERLLRRVTFDLTGLPPTVAEVEAFLADERPDAYDRVVDRLLASPHFGEHRARFWLDAARYGDTHGFHLDNYRSMWPYRDHVIRAFNANQPFDEFTVEQLAGDLLPKPTLEQQIATGFNRCNPTTAEGGLIAAEYLAHYAADRVETTSTVWLGLTVGCARCHDHKFDPISTRDFYRMFAFFNSIEENASDRNIPTPAPVIAAPTEEQKKERERLNKASTAIAERMRAPMPDVDRRQRLWEEEWAIFSGRSWSELVPTSAVSRGGATMQLGKDNTVLATGFSPANDVYEVVLRSDAKDLRALRIEALAHAESPGKGVGRASHNNIVLTDISVEAAPATRPLDAKPVALASACADWNQPNFPIQNALDGKPATGWAIDNGDSDDRTVIVAAAQPFGFDGGTIVRMRLGFESQYAQHTIGKLRISASSEDRVLPAVLGNWEVSNHIPAKNRTAAYALSPTSPEANGTAWTERPEFVDGKVHSLPAGLGATFLRRTIESPSDRDLHVTLGSDDSIRVFLNGEAVFEREVARPVALDQDRVTLRLAEGNNQLVLAVADYGGGHGVAFRVVGEDVLGIPNAVARVLNKPDTQRSKAELAAVRDHYRRSESPEWRELDDRRKAIATELAALDKAIPRTLVMRERKEPRPAHILLRGKYDQLGEKVDPGVPAALPPLPTKDRASRLDLARWLVDPNHPLTARVTVNRFWQSLFGRGLVATPEDFGSQGQWPSHPELLDWLAREFVESSWDVKHMFRTMVTSSTYRQASEASPADYAKDPDNIRLARGPRFRLGAESIRDQALAAGGLLVRDIGGPSVKPYQPKGLWRAVGYTSSNTARFTRDTGEKLYRRSLYTFWKRTSPPPSMQTFDAPTREACRVSRARTNTPLQALVLLNDVQFVEAARGFAVRILRDGGATLQDRIAFAFRTVTARAPNEREQPVLLDAIERQLSEYEPDEKAARKLITFGESKPPDDLRPTELAAWTAFAGMLLNLDEAITKG